MFLVLPAPDHFPERGLFPGLNVIQAQTTTPGFFDLILGQKSMYLFDAEIDARYRSEVDLFYRSVEPKLLSRGWKLRTRDPKGASVWVQGTRQLAFSADFPSGVDINDPRNKRQVSMIELYDSSTSFGERLRSLIRR